MEKKCPRCDGIFTAKKKREGYCPKCRKEVRKEYYQRTKEHHRKYHQEQYSAGNSYNKFDYDRIVKDELAGKRHIPKLFEGCSQQQILAMQTGNLKLLLQT